MKETFLKSDRKETFAMDLLEPLRYYRSSLAHDAEQNASDFFEELLKKSGVDEAENAATVKKYDTEHQKAKTAEKGLSRLRVFRTLLIIAAVLGGIAALVGAMRIADSLGPGLGLLLGGLAVLGGALAVIFAVLRPRIRRSAETLAELREREAEYYREAMAQMAPLNNAFSERDALTLVEKTLPDLVFDDRLTKEQDVFFRNAHDFIDFDDENSSVTDLLSGRLRGNPFLFCQRRVMEMRDETYHGTLVITWTETYRDSNGNLRRRTRTQTLHASILRPKPFYYPHVFLIYGNQAAPRLIFSRAPEHWEKLSEKQKEKKIREGEKELRRLSEKATVDGGNFQEMANTEFEVMLGATDRNNEVEFRLLYTPLGQRNTVELLENKEGFGDDFHLNKYKRSTVVVSEHMQKTGIDTSPHRYRSHSVALAREQFISFQKEFFRSLFFDFAPILAVPAYQEEPVASMEPVEDYPSNQTYYEHEILANALGDASFLPPEAATEAILKTSLSRRTATEDEVEVEAFSFSAHDRVEFVPVLGGDGRTHLVPVPWVEYLPVSAVSTVSVAEGEGGNVSKHGLSLRLWDR